MFGIGGSEILVILIVALLFLGPDKLPGAAKQISKGIRDLKKHSRDLQSTIENDETVGGAIRDLKSALRGEDPAPRRVKQRLVKSQKAIEMEADEPPDDDDDEVAAAPSKTSAVSASSSAKNHAKKPAPAALAEPAKKIKLSADAGDVDPDLAEGEDDREELAALVRPAKGTVAKGTVALTEAEAETIEPKHG